MKLKALPGVSFETVEGKLWKKQCLWSLIIGPGNQTRNNGFKSEVVHTQYEIDLVVGCRTKLLQEFQKSSLSGVYTRDSPVRGPFGQAEIWLKKEARPVSMPPYQIHGERRMALDKLIGEALDHHKMESGQGPWNTPIFPVPNKEPGSYRVVQDYRPRNL